MKEDFVDTDMPSHEEVLKLQKRGHTFHCAMRILCGDGECECNLTNHIPGIISAGMYHGRCPVCLMADGHKEWCRNKPMSKETIAELNRIKGRE